MSQKNTQDIEETVQQLYRQYKWPEVDSIIKARRTFRAALRKSNSADMAEMYCAMFDTNPTLFAMDKS